MGPWREIRSIRLNSALSRGCGNPVLWPRAPGSGFRGNERKWIHINEKCAACASRSVFFPAPIGGGVAASSIHGLANPGFILHPRRSFPASPLNGPGCGVHVRSGMRFGERRCGSPATVPRGRSSYGAILGDGVVDLRLRFGARYPTLVDLLRAHALPKARGGAARGAPRLPARRGRAAAAAAGAGKDPLHRRQLCQPQR